MTLVNWETDPGCSSRTNTPACMIQLPTEGFREHIANNLPDLPAGGTRLLSSALAKKWSFFTMKEPRSQSSSLGQSHNGLILESSLVFMPRMLSPILCGATTVSALRPSAHPHRGFQMLILPRLGAQLFSPVVRGACSLSLPLFGPLKCPYPDIPGNPTQSMAEGLPGGVKAAFPDEEATSHSLPLPLRSASQYHIAVQSRCCSLFGKFTPLQGGKGSKKYFSSAPCSV